MSHANEIDDADKLNRFGVGLQNDCIRILLPSVLALPITRAQAINLAAWLVAVADPERLAFDALLRRILEGD